LVKESRFKPEFVHQVQSDACHPPIVGPDAPFGTRRSPPGYKDGEKLRNCPPGYKRGYAPFKKRGKRGQQTRGEPSLERTPLPQVLWERLAVNRALPDADKVPEGEVTEGEVSVAELLLRGRTCRTVRARVWRGAATDACTPGWRSRWRSACPWTRRRCGSWWTRPGRRFVASCSGSEDAVQCGDGDAKCGDGDAHTRSATCRSVDTLSSRARLGLVTRVLRLL